MKYVGDIYIHTIHIDVDFPIVQSVTKYSINQLRSVHKFIYGKH